MQRYLSSTALSGSGASGGTLATAFTTLLSNDTIQVGDLVSLGSDGNAYWAADPTNGANLALAEHPFYLATPQGLTQIVAPVTVTAASDGMASSNAGFPMQSVILSNGNSVVAWVGSSAPYAVQFAIFNSSGVLQGSVTTVASSSATAYGTNLGLAALAGGGFAIAYQAASTYYVTFAVYSNSGVIVAGPTSVSTTYVPSGNGGQQVVALSSGGFAVVYTANNGSVYLTVAVYTASGGVTLAATSITTLGVDAGGTNQWSAFALSGGGFVVASAALSSTNVNFNIYSNAGAAVGSTGAVVSGESSTSTGVYGAALTAGGFVIVYGRLTGSTLGFGACVYNAAGALQGSAIAIDSVSVSAGNGWINQVGVVGLPNGNAQIVWASLVSTVTTCNIYAAQISAAGAQVGGNVALFSSGTANATVAIGASSDGGALVHYSVSSTAYTAKLNSAGAQVGVAVSSGSGVAHGVFDEVQFVNFGSNVVGKFYSSSAGGPATITLAIFYALSLVARVPVGVAQNAAGVGVSCSVQISGYATTRLTFAQPYSVNYSAGSPPGQNMTLVGNTAILNGV